MELFFQLHLMLNEYVRRFDVMGNVEKLLETKGPQSLPSLVAGLLALRRRADVNL